MNLMQNSMLISILIKLFIEKKRDDCRLTCFVLNNRILIFPEGYHIFCWLMMKEITNITSSFLHDIEQELRSLQMSTYNSLLV